ncbi:MAG: TdeIII family type II restriction endonuclease [Fimbriimonadales bacterium]|nr:TdeIII family type II restriction endonuclease [Fimbriimonadales bacterium]
MAGINKATRQQIKGYLEGFIEGMLAEYRRWQSRERVTPRQYLRQQSETPSLKPFHDAILPEEFRKVSAFERSFSTRLGTTFEESARLIALQNHAEAYRGYRIVGSLNTAALNVLEKQIERLDAGEPASLAEMTRLVLNARSGTNTRTIRIVADLFVKKHNGTELYFEMKSPVPNKGQCLEVTQRLLRIQLARGIGLPAVQTYFAMPYNPYGGDRSNYQWGYARRYLPFDDGVLIGEEFWNLLGGKGTYERLLEIYYEVGQAKANALLELLQDAP